MQGLHKIVITSVVVLAMFLAAGGVVFMLSNPIGSVRRVAPPPAEDSAHVEEISSPAASEPSPPADEAAVIENTVCSGPGGATMSIDEARSLAIEGECGQAGDLLGQAFCNDVTATWWLGLAPNEPKAGCNPACVVHVSDKSAEVNWRCTGAMPPSASGAVEPGAAGSGGTGSAAKRPSVCTGEGISMSYDDAKILADGSECGQIGTVGTDATCNPNSVTWWFDLEPDEPQAGCDPACVVYVGDGSAEVNWRCTGLIPPR